jgi:hypothetical protein
MHRFAISVTMKIGSWSVFTCGLKHSRCISMTLTSAKTNAQRIFLLIPLWNAYRSLCYI